MRRKKLMTIEQMEAKVEKSRAARSKVAAEMRGPSIVPGVSVGEWLAQALKDPSVTKGDK